MITLILLVVLALSFLDESVDWCMEKISMIDWKKLTSDTWNKIVHYAKTSGRSVTRVALHFYYTMIESDLELLDKVLIVAGIIYIIVPRDLLPKRAMGILGIADDAAVAAWIYDRIEKNMTPQILQKTEDTLDEWFGPKVVVEKIADFGKY